MTTNRTEEGISKGGILRDWISNNSAAITIASVVIIAALLAIKLWPAQTPQTTGDVISNDCWYYNVATGEYLRDKRDKVPPLLSDGQEIVRVVFYSCGACVEGERFPAYYLKHTPELKERAEADPGVLQSLYGESVPGRLISFDGRTWIEAPSAEAAGVNERYRNTCDGKGGLRVCR